MSFFRSRHFFPDNSTAFHPLRDYTISAIRTRARISARKNRRAICNTMYGSNPTERAITLSIAVDRDAMKHTSLDRPRRNITVFTKSVGQLRARLSRFMFFDRSKMTNGRRVLVALGLLRNQRVGRDLNSRHTLQLCFSKQHEFVYWNTRSRCTLVVVHARKLKTHLVLSAHRHAIRRSRSMETSSCI